MRPEFPRLLRVVVGYVGCETRARPSVTLVLRVPSTREGRSGDRGLHLDALERLPGSSEVDVRCEGGRVTVSGTVHYKRLKRDVGEIACAIPGVHDVHNTVTIAARRRARAVTREGESPGSVNRKTA